MEIKDYNINSKSFLEKDNVKGKEKKRKSAEDNEQPMPDIPVSHLKAITSVASSVGMICGYQKTGTVFRVGSDKIMTAWHVVRCILSKYT